MGSLTLRGVLFDKDGTLIDFHRTWMPLYRKAADMVASNTRRPELAEALLKAAGYDEAMDRCQPGSLLASGTNDEVARLWSRVAGIEGPAMTDAILRLFETDAPALSVPVENLETALEALKTRGMTLGVATMDSQVSAAATLARLNVDRHFQFVCGYDSGHGHKPGPGMVEAFCASTGLEPAEILMVGDTPHDLNMGRSAGVARVVGVLTGSSTRSTLAPLADEVVESIFGLAGLLDKWEAGSDR